MSTFQDLTGDKWVIALDVATLLAIKKEVGVDLLDKPEEFPATTSGFVDMLWITLQDQIKAANLDEMGFAKRLSLDTIEQASEKFVDELHNFFLPTDAARAKLIKTSWTGTKLQESMHQKIIEKALGIASIDLEALSESISAN